MGVPVVALATALAEAIEACSTPVRRGAGD